MNGPVRGNARYPETGALIHHDTFGQASNLINGDYCKLCRSTKRPIGLCSIAPDPLAEPFGRNTITNFIHLPSPVTVWNDAGVRHTVAKRILTLLDMACVIPDAATRIRTSPATGCGIGHLSDY